MSTPGRSRRAPRAHRVQHLHCMMAWLAAAAVATSIGCAPKPLPEEGSPPALLYAARCGTTCHRPYQPGSLKPKMWETMLARMEIEMARRGMPLSTSERAELLAYLIRNAGTM